MEEPLGTRACPLCGKAVAVAAKFCSECGAPRDVPATGSGQAQAKWYHNLLFVLVMLFFVLGPFGLPLVWKNPRFSRGLKIGLTAATSLYTIWLVVLTIRMAKAVMEGVNQFNSTLQF